MDLFDIFLLEAVINGLLLGGLLALLALGLNLIFGVIDVVWISYAELMMVGMYAIYWMYIVQGAPLWVGFGFGIAMVALLGAAMHWFIIRPVLTA
jgi:branched-chain amino acid transport system permease protein